MKKYYTLTTEQRNFWIEWLLDPQSTVNNICLFYKLNGDLNAPLFQRAVIQATKNTLPFKIRFIKKNNDAHFYINKNAKPNFNYHDSKNFSFNSNDEEINYLHSIINKPFDLISDDTHRLILFKSRQENTFYFIACFPHILIDGYSGDFLLKEISDAYNLDSYKLKSTAEEISTVSSKIDEEKSSRYWSKKIENISSMNWNTDNSLLKTGTRSYLYLKKEEVKLFKKTCYREKTTTFLGLITAFSLLLYRYYDTPDISILYSVDLRNRNQKNSLGSFINLIPILFLFDESDTYSDVLKKITRQRKSDRVHQNYPLEKIIKHLRQKKGLNKFNLIFSRAKILPNGFNLNKIHIEYVPFYPKTAIADLALLYDESEEGIIFALEYSSSLFNNDFIKQMLEHFKILLFSLGENPDKKLENYSILSAQEQAKILQFGLPKHHWQSTKLSSVTGQFKITAQQNLTKIAVVINKETFTYQQLEESSNQIGRYLLKTTQSKTLKIAFLLNRSYSTVQLILGITKASCIYIPLDTSYPPARLQYILDDANVDLLITEQFFDNVTKNLNIKKIIDINVLLENARFEKTTTPELEIDLSQLAYVIYTSGSTGKPKGVPITHYNLTRLFKITDKYFDFRSTDKWSLFHSFAFDFSVWEMWGALLHGHELHIIPDNVRRSPFETYQYIHQNKITIFNQTPFAFKQFLSVDHSQKRTLALRFIIFGGEKLNPMDLSLWFSNHPENKPVLINMYGLTEATVHATYYRLGKEDSVLKMSLIGKPLADLGAYVLNKHHQLAPVGVVGELFLEGAGLTKGYINKPKLNKVRFIPSPFSQSKEDFLYATGDLVRWLPDGNLEYIERRDKQLKLNGYRIELEEVKQALQNVQGIRQAIAFVYESKNTPKQLIGFYQSEDENSIESSYISEQLKKLLPYYMIPNRFILLKQIPLTSQGKLDTDYLHNLAQAKEGVSHKKNLNLSFKEQLLKIWQQTLNNPMIKSTDSFFEIGGDSLILLDIHTKIQQVFECELPVTELFYYPTVEKLAEYLAILLKKEDNYLPHSHAQDFSSLENMLNEPIAIIGMAANLPDAPDIHHFWQNLSQGKEGIVFFSDKELQDEGIPVAEFQAPSYVRAKGFVSHAYDFDASFFGISPSEATILDPQHRLLLECAWSALEDAGYVDEKQGGKIGVFVSQSNINNYLQTYLLNNPAVGDTFNDYQLYINNNADFLSTRLSYKFNFTGPSFTVQSGCSSSLLAVAQACQSLRNQQCTLAIAGGVTLTMPLKSGYPYQEGMILSPDGHCRVFDSKANGTVPGNGVGVIVLKRLSEALKDNDHIEAIIKGFAINNDGANKLSFAAPNKQGQSEVIQNALLDANCKTRDITYLEAHGTGTSLGDPIEIAALSAVFKKESRGEPCMIGSVKSNIGHLDAAAGVVGLIKTALCLKYKYLVPNVHFQHANKNLDLNNTPFEVVKDYRPWKTTQLPRRAGVSAFAVGGTNVHVVLEENRQEDPKITNKDPEHLIILSAKSPVALMNICRNTAYFLDANPACCLNDVSYTLQVGRKSFDYRLAFTRATNQEISAYLKDIDHNAANISTSNSNALLAFLLPGQGSSYIPIAKEFYSKLPVFTEIVDICKEYLKTHHQIEIKEVKSNQSQPNPSIQTTLGIFIMEYALAKQWMAWGVEPSSLLGYSLGEYVAACLAGIWSLENTLEILLMRSTLISTTGAGSMLSVALGKKTILPYLNKELALAVDNSLTRCVISGSQIAIHNLMKELTANDIPCKLLEVSHAFHSPFMDSITDIFYEKLKNYTFNSPQISIISNVTGKLLTDDEAKDPKYWVNHLRCTVQFSEGIRSLIKNHDLFLEIGIESTLSAFVKQHAKTKKCFNLAKRSNSTVTSLLTTIGDLWSQGISVDWLKFNEQKIQKRVSLPTYPFEHKTYRIEKYNKIPTIPIKEKNERNVKDWFYIPAWDYKDLPIFTEKNEKTSLFLVFKDSYGLSDEVISLIKKRGCSVITVASSKTFISAEHHYEIHPQSFNDYKQLANCLIRKNQLPNKILYFWPLMGVQTMPSINMNLSEELTSLIYLNKILFSFDFKSKTDLMIIINGLWSIFPSDKVEPHQSLLLGPILTLPQEQPGLTCRAIDIDFFTKDKKFVSQISADIFQEAMNEDHTDILIAYRHNQRLIKAYHKTILGNDLNINLSLKAVYLIVGGLGGIGLTFAKYFAQKGSTTIILLQRTPFPHKKEWNEIMEDAKTDSGLKTKIKTLQEIEALGNKLYIASMDITNIEQVTKTFRQIEQQFGEITGVIHAAGIASGSMIQTISPEQITRTLAPKVLGAINIYQILKNTPPRFTFFCSALSSITGLFGQVAYNSANAFLDAFAIWLSSQNYPALSINWDAWQEIGMAAKIKVSSFNKEKIEKQLKDSIQENEAIQLFPYLLKLSLPQVIISTTSIEDKISLLKSISPAFLNCPNDIIKETTQKTTNNIEAKIEKVWKECLGVISIKPNDNFFELGGDSLLGVQFSAILREQYKINIRLQDLLETSTFEKLIEKIALRSRAMHNNQEDSFFPLLHLRKGTSDINLFLMHPVGGTVFVYRSLAEKINPAISVYGLQSRSLDDVTDPVNNVESIALDYIKCIQSIQPSGPYYLAGASFGGTLAYEIAQQLQQANQRVNFLAMFDTPGLGQMPAELPTDADILIYMLQIGAQKKINIKKFYKLTLEQQLQYFLAHAGGLKKALPSFDISHMKRYLQIYQANIEAMFRYIPKSYQGQDNIHFFKALERDNINPQNPEQGWKNLLQEKLILHSVSGNHINLLFDPNVSELASQLNLLLATYIETRYILN